MKPIDENEGWFVSNVVRPVKENRKTSLLVAFAVFVAILMLL